MSLRLDGWSGVAGISGFAGVAGFGVGGLGVSVAAGIKTECGYAVGQFGVEPLQFGVLGAEGGHVAAGDVVDGHSAVCFGAVGVSFHGLGESGMGVVEFGAVEVDVADDAVEGWIVGVEGNAGAECCECCVFFAEHELEVAELSVPAWCGAVEGDGFEQVAGGVAVAAEGHAGDAAGVEGVGVVAVAVGNPGVEEPECFVVLLLFDAAECLVVKGHGRLGLVKWGCGSAAAAAVAGFDVRSRSGLAERFDCIEPAVEVVDGGRYLAGEPVAKGRAVVDASHVLPALKGCFL